MVTGRILMRVPGIFAPSRSEAGEVDAAEDELYGEARGDELPEHLRTHEGRRAALREANSF